MIGNHHARGEQGYTILEEGEIHPATLTLEIQHYLVCRPDGEALPETFTREQACRRIEALEAASRAGNPHGRRFSEQTVRWREKLFPWPLTGKGESLE